MIDYPTEALIPDDSLLAVPGVDNVWEVPTVSGNGIDFTGTGIDFNG